MNIKEYVADCLSNMTDQDIVKKYKMKDIKEMRERLHQQDAQTEIRIQNPITDEEREGLKQMAQSMKECQSMFSAKQENTSGVKQ